MDQTADNDDSDGSRGNSGASQQDSGSSNWNMQSQS